MAEFNTNIREGYTLRERILSGAVLILFLLAVVFFNDSFPLALNLAIALISSLAVFELVKAVGFHQVWFVAISSIAAAAIVPILQNDWQVFMLYIAYTVFLFALMIREHKRLPFTKLAIVYALTIIIPVALNTLLRLRTLGGQHGMFYVLVAILAAWVSDAGAYFAGTFWGKRKLCPDISPKKTVAGFIGGIVFNAFCMIIFGLLFTYVLYQGEKHVNYLILFIIGICGSLLSVLGDLSFSLIKRSCQIKDFGTVIPGHGGILDRFDSVIFTAPFVYILVTYFPIVIVS